MTNIFDRYAYPELLSRVFLEMYISAAKYRKSIQPQYIKIPIIIETNMHLVFCYFNVFMEHPFTPCDVLLNLYWVRIHYNLNCSSANNLENSMESFAFSYQTQWKIKTESNWITTRIYKGLTLSCFQGHIVRRYTLTTWCTGYLWNFEWIWSSISLKATLLTLCPCISKSVFNF